MKKIDPEEFGPEIMFDAEHPDQQQIVDARTCAGLTRQEAASSVHLKDKARWSEYERGVRNIDLARWELFLIKNALHPDYETRRRG